MSFFQHEHTTCLDSIRASLFFLYKPKNNDFLCGSKFSHSSFDHNRISSTILQLGVTKIETPPSSSGSSVFVGLLVSGLLAALAITIGYFKCQRRTDTKGVRLVSTQSGCAICCAVCCHRGPHLLYFLVYMFMPALQELPVTAALFRAEPANWKSLHRCCLFHHRRCIMLSLILSAIVPICSPEVVLFIQFLTLIWMTSYMACRCVIIIIMWFVFTMCLRVSAITPFIKDSGTACMDFLGQGSCFTTSEIKTALFSSRRINCCQRFN